MGKLAALEVGGFGDGGREVVDGTDFEVAVVDLGAFGLDLEFTFGKRSFDVALADVFNGEDDFAIDYVDRFVADRVDFNFCPLAVRAFLVGGDLNASFLKVRSLRIPAVLSLA